ncbi:MAG: OmpA family protein [Methylacidiphilales bacterium]|nr:OmpA family protein [Candidatus Methylacidiphilales bacterium]
MKSSLPLLIALTFALVACDDSQKPDNYTSMGADNGSGLPNSDTVNPGDASSGIPPSPRGDFNPNDVDNQTLASDTIYFDFDKSTIGSAERNKLQAVSDWFKANPGHSLFLAGHADKRGTPEYNRALGERRALAVREYLVGLGLPAASLYTNSYGSDRPAVDGDTEEAYAKNRRVEIGVIAQKQP